VRKKNPLLEGNQPGDPGEIGFSKKGLFKENLPKGLKEPTKINGL